jgi:tetratricopeptide (TPR) repeat protein
VYGTLVDGHVEMGDYKAAVENADKMISLRPDLRSYSRVSYLREIYGNYPGAIEAMKMAVDAGPAGDETTAWTRVQLGHLYELSGNLAHAKMNYTIALEERPGYANALAGLGSLAVAAKDYPTAINYYEQASKTVMDYTYKESLVDLYRITGNNAKATELANSIIETMTANAEAGLKDPTVGHYSDRELAYAFLKINDNDKALEHALAEYNRRPDNIDVNETLAWVYYAKGEYSKAVPYMEVALKTNSRNPVLLSRAGLIYQAVHNNAKTKACLQAALEHDASFDMNLKAKATAAWRSL